MKNMYKLIPGKNVIVGAFNVFEFITNCTDFCIGVFCDENFDGSVNICMDDGQRLPKYALSGLERYGRIEAIGE
jgi:hypothetical protein